MDTITEDRTSQRCLQLDARLVGWLVLAFVVCLSTHAYRYVKHHPDERHYTDAAIQMVETGNYLTPRRPDGRLRFEKPILTYWLVATSYRLLGVSPFSSRFPFVLVGAAVIWITYRIGLHASGKRRTGLLAALIVSIQPALLISSPRSIPDIVFTFFVVLSTYGFVRLFREPEPSWFSIGLAYLGCGLAVEARGLPAIVFGIFASTCFVLFRRAAFLAAWRRHLLGMTGGALIGLSWIALMYLWHAETFTFQFGRDQVSGRVTRNMWEFVGDLPRVFGVLLLCLLPCWAPLAMAWRKRCDIGNRSFQRLDPVVVLLAAWCLLFLLLASCVGRVNVRYQTPIVPMVSVLVALGISSLNPRQLRRWLTGLARTAGGTIVVASLILILSCLRTNHIATLAPVVAVASLAWAAGLIFMAGRLSWQHAGLAACATLLLLMPLSFLASVNATRSVEERILARVESLEDLGSVGFLTKPSYPSRLRVLSGARIKVEWAGHSAAGRREPVEHHVLVLRKEDTAQIDLSQYEIELVENGYQGVRADGFLRALAGGDLDTYLAEHRRHLALAVRQAADRQPIAVASDTARTLR